MFLGGGVAKRDVDFPLLERRRVTPVVDTYDQLFRLCHCFKISKQMLDLVLFPSDSGGFVPVPNGWCHRQAARGRFPLRLRQRPRP
jgi:hypothetical protein